MDVSTASIARRAVKGHFDPDHRSALLKEQGRLAWRSPPGASSFKHPATARVSSSLRDRRCGQDPRDYGKRPGPDHRRSLLVLFTADHQGLKQAPERFYWANAPQPVVICEWADGPSRRPGSELQRDEAQRSIGLAMRDPGLTAATGLGYQSLPVSASRSRSSLTDSPARDHVEWADGASARAPGPPPEAGPVGPRRPWWLTIRYSDLAESERTKTNFISKASETAPKGELKSKH